MLYVHVQHANILNTYEHLLSFTVTHTLIPHHTPRAAQTYQTKFAHLISSSSSNSHAYQTKSKYEFKAPDVIHFLSNFRPADLLSCIILDLW